MKSKGPVFIASWPSRGAWHSSAIGITVKDLNKSTKFYRMLGLNFPEQTTEDHVEATTKAGLRLMLDSEALMKKLHPEWAKPVGQAMTLAFRCDSPQEVNDLYQRLRHAGYEGRKEPWDAFWGQRYATVLDPDGYAVDLFAPL